MLTEKIKDIEVGKIKKDLVFHFGDMHDGAIELAGMVDQGLIEIGYFYGDSKPKNILVVSSQAGCPSKCSFCALGNEPYVRNLSPEEIYEQVVLMLRQAAQYRIEIDAAAHKVNYSKSGDALFNPRFAEGLEQLAGFGFSHKVSTVFPYGRNAMNVFCQISDFAATYSHPVQFQISLISTLESYREQAAGVRVANFKDIRKAAL